MANEIGHRAAEELVLVFGDNATLLEPLALRVGVA